MTTHFDRLTLLKNEWNTLQPLKSEQETKLWRKLRLEWNYHSNHIEGNTLTYGETELLLLHDRTTGNHTHREYLEMKAHDVGIEHVRVLAADTTRLLTESDVRDLNRIILKESFWKPAETADGQPTRKEIIPGQYKTSPNNVRTATGEIFFFASVEDTAPKMQALMQWMFQELTIPVLHPVAFAAKLHHDFVLIHPFDDGNGRVARLLVNYVLLRNGYLPIIVRTEDKVNYLTALQLADAGDLIPLTEYLLNLAEWSLNIGIKAGKGESIDEPSDVEKEVALFVRDQEARKTGIAPVSKNTLQELCECSLKPFLELVKTKLKQLVMLFRKFEISSSTDIETITSWTEIYYWNFKHLSLGDKFMISFMFYNYQGETVAPFDFITAIEIHFSSDHYKIIHNQSVIVSNPYSKFLLSDEAEVLSSEILSSSFERIKVKAKGPTA
jgi:Fic family protein